MTDEDSACQLDKAQQDLDIPCQQDKAGEQIREDCQVDELSTCTQSSLDTAGKAISNRINTGVK